MASIGGLYVLIDPSACRGRNPVEVGRAALEGGARMLQWRDKLRDKGEQLSDARALYELCQNYDATLIINDHADLALVLAGGRSPERGAIGVHVGQHDLPLEALWSIVPDYFVVGASTNNPDEALAAERAGADYVAVGDLFGTTAKTGTRPASPARLKEVKDKARVPVIGIGGINASNVREVIEAGADGIAVISAVCSADDPEAAARELIEAMRRGAQQRT
jgi:thiamine-phosphate diphosphorylase